MTTDTLGANLVNYVEANPITTAAAVIGTTALTAGAAVGISKAVKSRSRKKKRKHSSKRKSRHRRKRYRRTPRTAGKGKDRSHRRIRYTKKGQPYVITRNGRAKFIKKSSAKRSHKMKGGRY